MKNLFKYATVPLLMVLIYKSVNAQRYDNIYKAADAYMMQVWGNDRIDYTLKGVAILFPNGSNQLHVTLNIPYNIIDNKSIADSGFLSPGYLFRLKVNIDPQQIQEVLTSVKTFITHGFLTLNGITRTVALKYIPMVSGTEENGNFNIYMTIQFNATDFNLGIPDNNIQYVIKIKDVKVNRI